MYYLYLMEKMIDLILQFGGLNKQQIEFLLSKVEMVEFKKDDYLSEAGKVPRYVAFVLEGVFRFCYYNNKGEEVTNYFVDEGNFVSDHEKFESQIVASEYVQAVTDCKVLVFNKKGWDEISNTIVGWDMMKANMVKNALPLPWNGAVRWFRKMLPPVTCRSSKVFLTL